MKLTLGNLAHLAEIIGAVAIVISLIYVGQELNANTAAVQAASLQSVTNASSVSMLAVVENEDFARIRVQAMRDPAQLSETEQLRWFLYQRQMWLHFQNVWQQWELGTLDNGIWEGYERVICRDLLSDEAARKQWQETHAFALSTEFVSHVGQCG
jgi:hypothetical protein